MKVSIIIVNYNVRHFLEQCIRSVKSAITNLEAEIIVVDNNSKDDSCAMIKEKFPKVILIENKDNTGFSKANNQGVAIAKGEYVLILNPDTFVPETIFSALIKTAEEKVNIGAIGVRLIDGTGSFLPESKRGIPTPAVSFNKLFGISSKYTGRYYASHLKEKESGVVEILVGAFMFMKRSIYEEVEGFDETFFMYGEDIDLSYKILKKGYKNYYLGNVSTVHYKGESTNKDIIYLKHFYEAMKIFYRKHFKLNVLYDMMMSLGIRFWYLMKYINLHKLSGTSKKVTNFIYVGDNKETFQKLQNHYTKHTGKLQSLEEIKQKSSPKDDYTIIFDNNSVKNLDIIEYMSKNKSLNLVYRFIPKNTTFIIGSDCSVGRGNLVNL